MGPVPRWFLVGVVLILAVPTLTMLLNYSPLGDVVTTALRSRLGLEVSSFHLRLLPRPGIELSDIVMRSDSDRDAVFRARRASVSLRLTPLLRKRLALVELIVVQPKIVARRDRHGQWHLPFSHGPRQRDGAGETEGFKFQWMLPDVELRDGEVVIADDFERRTPFEIVLRDVHATVHTHVLRRKADVAVTATRGEGGIAIEGLMSLVRTGSEPSPPTAVPLGFEGSVELTRFDLIPWLMFLRQPSDASVQPINVAAHVAVSPGTLGYDVAASDIRAALSWVRLQGQALIRHAGTDQTAYTGTFSATPVSVATLLNELPEAWIPVTARGALATHHVSGTVEIVSAGLSGFVGSRPTWNVTAKLSQGRGTFGPDGLSVHDVVATLFAEQDHLQLLNLSGGVGGMRVSDGRLDVTHVDVAPTLDLTLTGSGTVRELVTVLHDFGEGGAGETVLKTITNPAGEVQLSIHAAGPLVPDPEVKLVSADITVQGLGAYLPRLKLSVEHLDGTVGVRKDHIDFKHLQGTAGAIHFDAVGSAEIGANPRFDEVTVELSAQGEDLQQLVSARTAQDHGVVVQGPVHAALRLSGPVTEPTFTGRLDLTQLDIAAAPVVRKRAGLAAALDVKGSFVRGQRLSLKEASLVLPSARLDGHARVRLASPSRFEIWLEGGPLPVTGLADILVLGPLADGVIEAAVTLKGEQADWRSWTTAGRINLRRGVIAVPGLRDPVRDVALALQLADQDLLIKRVAFRVGDSDLSATGVVKQWTSRPDPTLLVESSKLDITRLLPMKGKEREASGLEPFRRWVEGGRADITVKINQAHYHRLTFRTLAAHLHVEPGVADLELTKGDTPQGTVSGRVRVSAPGERPLAVDGNLQIDGMPVQQVMSVMDPDADRLRGLLSFDGRVEGSLQPGVPLLHTITSRGPMQLKLVEGRVLHGTVLPKVLKVLNVPAILQGEVNLDRDGIPFDAVSATVSARDGELSSENLLFESPLMKITGAGTWNLASDDLNVALAVSPFGSYSELIGKIPLFGRLLEGDRPGLTTALFEVTGPLKDPDVRYLPVESLAKGLTGYPRLAIDLLKNTVSLPLDLMAPSKP